MYRTKSYSFLSIPLLWLLVLCLPAASCRQKKKPQEQKQVIVLEDGLGRQVKLFKQPKRVMGLSSAMTEILFAVCDTATIVGITPDVDYPAAALKKPVVNNYPVDYEQLLALKPDIVFTSEGITPLDVTARLEELGIPVYYQKYRTVEDVLKGIETVGYIMDRREVAQHLTDSLYRQVRELQQKHSKRKNPLQVLTITWTDPIYVYGQNTLLTDKLRILGAENAVKEVFDQPYPALTREYILKLNPDVLLGGTPEKLEQTFFNQYPELRKIKAYEQQRIYAPTDNLIARPSPRVVESIKELERLLYP